MCSVRKCKVYADICRHMLLICTAEDRNVHIAYIKMQRCILYAEMYIIYAEMCVIYETYKHHL